MTSRDRAESSKWKDEGSQLEKQQRKILRQRSICSPRRLMNSPPPKHTPPFPTDDLSPNVRGTLSPSPRRISTTSVSTPLYVINSNTPSATVEQRPLTPGIARPVLMKMATITSPTSSRPVSPLPSRSLDDSGCNYTSLHQGDRKEDLVEDEIRDSVRLQKMFRKLQRQIHSPDRQVDCHIFEPSICHDPPAPRRLTLGNIGRSETVASPEPSKPPVRHQRERRCSLEKISTRLSMADPDISIELGLDSVSSPMLERPCTLPEVNSRPASRIMKSFSCDGVDQPLTSQEDLENQKRKTASAIVTSGALTFMILAAALVTASFLMSPVIEDVFVKGRLFGK